MEISRSELETKQKPKEEWIVDLRERNTIPACVLTTDRRLKLFGPSPEQVPSNIFQASQVKSQVMSS